MFASWFLRDGANLSCFLLMEHRDEAGWPTWVQTLAPRGWGTYWALHEPRYLSRFNFIPGLKPN